MDLIDKFIMEQNFDAAKLDFTEFIAYKINKDHLLLFLSFLKNDTNLRFTILTDLFGADFAKRTKRFELVYNLLSLKLNKRLLIKIDLAEEEQTPSITQIFSASNWYEREIFDMFGITFINHPNMSRILTDYGFVGHPLRKDFPLSGYMEVTYDKESEMVIYEPLALDQEFRSFDFTSPWQGPNYVLPGDEKATKS